MRVDDVGWLDGFVGLTAFAVRATGSIPGALIWHAREVIGQFEQVAVRSLPIVLGAGLSVGLVTWLQTHRLLAEHGAESTLPSFLAVAVLVEIGPVLAGLLVASRMGAGLAAELASMVFNEEIDARNALGVDPVPSLVAPRAMACALAVPLLTVILDASALIGGPRRRVVGRQADGGPVLEQGAGVPPALRHHPGDPQDDRFRSAGGTDRLLDRLERRPIGRGRRPGRNPWRRPGHPGRVRRQRRDGPADSGGSRRIGIQPLIVTHILLQAVRKGVSSCELSRRGPPGGHGCRRASCWW